MPTIKKYIIKPDNVKNPFQMRATSPVNKNGVKEGHYYLGITGDGKSKDYSDTVSSLATITAPRYKPQTTLDQTMPPIVRFGVDYDGDKTTHTSDKAAEFYKDLKDKQKTPSSVRTEERAKRVQNRQINRTIRQEDRLKSRVGSERFEEIKKRKSPANYSVPNPFTPRQQDIVGNIYNPGGGDINQFEQSQAFNKFASNPNTLNEPPIPTEAQTTMNDLQMENEPMNVFGENLPGALNPRQQRKADRRSRRADRRANRQGGFKNFVRQSVGGALTGIMPIN